MKADLYIGDDVHSVEIISTPFPGQLVIHDGYSHRISDVVHDCDKKKLRLVCNIPAGLHVESVREIELTAEETDVDILHVNLGESE
jgi:hypothetical protein